MTSLAVLPPLKKTLTDLMEEELYQAPGSPAATAFASDFDPTSNAATLSNLLNIPDSFVEHYNKVNGSNNAVNSIPSLTLDSSNDFNSFDFDSSSAKVNPFNAYAAPDALSESQLPQNLQYPLYVKPELVQQRSVLQNGARRSRITTLEQPDTGKQKDDDYYLFDTDIQPSHMLTNRNYFNTEDYLDNSLFIMNSDLDLSAKFEPNLPVPGYEGDYLAMDDFAEDAEDLSEDSDDDNYFQDDNDDFDNYIMNSNDFATRIPSTDSYMRVLPPSQEEFAISAGQDGYMDTVRKIESTDSMDVQQDFTQPVVEETLAETSVEPVSGDNANMHIPVDFHQTGAEISAMNPNHQCDLINPSTGLPCNKQFSRSYDLIRHQETIHASKKKIFRCVICEGRVNGGPGNGKLKTFSRGDALSRHIKVKHGLGGDEAVQLINDAKENVEYLMA